MRDAYAPEVLRSVPEVSPEWLTLRRREVREVDVIGRRVRIAEESAAEGRHGRSAVKGVRSW